MAKPGDTVRYLNSVGGGKITRIEGNIAYIDEDGFETPVLLRECVVVQNSGYFPPLYDTPKPAAATKSGADGTKAQNAAEPAKPEPADYAVELPYIETKAGERLNVVLAFEAVNPKSLSTSSYEAYLVNDSNYYLSVLYLSRESDSEQWTLRRADTIEPGIELLLEEFDHDDVPSLERICVQIQAYKKDKPFAMKPPVSVELKLDVTKFFKLHCFVPNSYFDRPVIALPLITDDEPASRPDIAAIIDDAKMQREAASKINRDRKPAHRTDVNKPKHVREKFLEVDLHIAELVDTTAGLSASDMLNLQIDTFRRVMDEHIADKGFRIVFIHGKGDGVLRKALLKELSHRYKTCRWQDASFREYGFGATQVEIH